MLKMRVFISIAAAFVICTINIQCIDTAEYYVSSNGTLCPDNTICHNLSFYIFQYDRYFTNDTVFNFLEGTHVLEHQQLLLPGLQNVTLNGVGNIEQRFVSQSTVILSCNAGIGGVVFLSCTNITIKGITINNCNTNTNYDLFDKPLYASLAIYNSSNINMEIVSIQNSSQYGLVMVNVLNMTITKCSFARNAYAYNSINIRAVFLDYMTTTKKWNILLQDSNITSSVGGLFTEFLQKEYTVNFNLQGVKFINNINNMFFLSTPSCKYNLQLNEVVSSGAHVSLQSYQHNCLSNSKPTIKITNSIFEYNYGDTFTLLLQTGIVSIESTRFIANSGFSMLYIAQQRKRFDASCFTLKVKLFNVTFKDNKITETLSLETEEKVIATINDINDVMMTNCTFADNDGSGLLIHNSYVTFTGSNIFINNTGIDGGAMLLMNNALMLLQNDTNISFINNHATKMGGAIYVAHVYHTYYCFYQLSEPMVEPIRKYFHFQNNTANIAGSAVYGGIISDCDSGEFNHYIPLEGISTFVDQTGYSVISSNARRICFCEKNVPNFSETEKHFTISPGFSFNFTVTAVGNRNGTTPGFVQVRDDSAIHPITNFTISAKCMPPITHSVQVTNSSLSTIDIYVTLGDFESNTLPNILLVRVDIEPCPAGFYLSNVTRVCECIEEISLVANCDSSTGTIERSGSLWISYDSEYNCTIVVDQQCPFDYCNFSTVNFTLTKPNDQCSFNRKGQLCGGCEEHFSVVFGSNKCKECNSNLYILLIIPFASAGIILVVFLLILNLTVSVGTINGLIFYANIVKLYEHQFPTEPIPFLSQFISWINLDLGIETCFYKGMNACEKTGLQFIFPFYLWFIIGLIILLARYFSKITKLVGNNATPVLATLLLLSYTKLLRTVILILSTTHISCKGNPHVVYWFIDANIAYFRSCHLPLFITAVIVLILLVVPYTLFLLLFPLLEFSNDQYRSKLSFLIKFKPFFDAYGGPYNDKFRFWPGILLLARVVLALSVGLSDKFGPAFGCLIAIAVILIITLSYVKVYTSIYIYVLDIWFMLSLMIMAYIIQENVSSELSSSNEVEYRLIIILNFSLTFVIFCGIIFYHVYTHSVIGQDILQKWYAKIISYKKTNLQSQRVEQLPDVSEENMQDNVPSTDCYTELREPLLGDPFL